MIIQDFFKELLLFIKNVVQLFIHDINICKNVISIKKCLMRFSKIPRQILIVFTKNIISELFIFL